MRNTEKQVPRKTTEKCVLYLERHGVSEIGRSSFFKLVTSLTLGIGIIFCSLPITWRTANITPIPKVRLVTNLKNELRPISLTPCLSKMAEELIVNDYIKPAVLKIIDPRQFGTVPGSSTVISMFHKWLGDTDGTGSTIRVLLCDYSKAFDLIDHRLLVNKIKQLDIPNSVINWVISFLTCRLQRVKLTIVLLLFRIRRPIYHLYMLKAT